MLNSDQLLLLRIDTYYVAISLETILM